MTPNQITSLDAAMMLLFQTGRQLRDASEFPRSALRDLLGFQCQERGNGQLQAMPPEDSSNGHSRLKRLFS